MMEFSTIIVAILSGIKMMDFSTIIVAILSLIGTLAGTFGGIMTSNKLTGYRIEQLEKKLDTYSNSHNDLISRVIKLEDADALMNEKIKVANHRLDDLEKASREG